MREGRVVGEGWHTEYGKAHAEVEALRRAGEEARGATLYVSLEPCSHHGKTGPCTEAIRAAGIARVVYASADPDPLAKGGGQVLREAGIEVRSGVEAELAAALNGPFFRAHLPEAPPRPWTELKLALSIDGKVADHQGRSTWITGNESRAEVHRLRAGHDAIAVGIGTALADDPSLTVRGTLQPRVPPIRVVFDRQARLPPTSRLARSAGEIPVWVVCGPEASATARRELQDAGVHILEAASLPEALAELRSAGLRSLFCEGGGRIAYSLLREGLVDRLTLFIAPLLLGPEGLDPFQGLPSRPLAEAHRWRLVRSTSFGPDVLISVEP